MAEETKYIPYGQDEISQQELQTALANDLPNFMNKYKWLQKPKNRDTFLKIYSDMVNGLTGASNDSGLWSINTSNDMNSYLMSPREKEIAEHAAYYIQQQMAKMTPRSKAEEAKKEDLTPFKFQESFGKQLLNLYGGDPKIFGDSEQGWNSLDARGTNGLRGTEKRKKKMAEQLDLYRQELANGKDYNFEGTSFKDKQDALTKLQTAIDALRNTPNDESDDLPAFSALGLNYRNFFSNGGNEELTLEDGRKTTYQEYYQEQQKKKADEAKAKAELAKQQRANQYDGYKYYDFSKFNGRPLTAQESSVEYLNNLIAKDKWTGDEVSQIVQAFKLAKKNGQLVPITDKNELSKFSSMWKNRTKQLRKINGIEGIYYDTVGKKFVKPYKNGQTPQTSFQDVLNQNNPEAIAKNKELAEQKAQKNYLNQKGAEYAELGAIAADIASIIDPEPFSAMGLSLGAAGARNWAKVQQPGKWDWKDYTGQTVDYLTSVIGAVPIVGDAVLAAKVVRGLRGLARVGAWMDTVNTYPALKTIWEKKINGNESLTVDDWRTIGQAIRGIVSHGRMNQSNLATRQVLQQRGVNVNPENVKGIKANINKWAQKTGFTQTKPTQIAQTTTSIKIKNENGDVVEIPITEKVKQDLETKFKGKSNKEKLEIVKNNSEIQAAAKGKLDLTKATGLDASSSIRNLKGIRNFIGTNRGIFNQQTNYSQIPRTNDNFDNYLKNRSTWDKIKFGSNNYLKRIDKQLNLGQVQTPTNNSTLRQNKSLENSLFTPEKLLKRETKVLKLDNHGNKGIKGDAVMEYEGMKFKYDADYNSYLQFTNGSWKKIKDVKSLKEFKQFIAESIKKHHNITSSQDIKKLTESQIKKIKELKRKGFLYKQGGQINFSLDKIIEDFIKNNNI